MARACYMKGKLKFDRNFALPGLTAGRIMDELWGTYRYEGGYNCGPVDGDEYTIEISGEIADTEIDEFHQDLSAALVGLLREATRIRYESDEGIENFWLGEQELRIDAKLRRHRRKLLKRATKLAELAHARQQDEAETLARVRDTLSALAVPLWQVDVVPITGTNDMWVHGSNEKEQIAVRVAYEDRNTWWRIQKDKDGWRYWAEKVLGGKKRERQIVRVGRWTVPLVVTAYHDDCQELFQSSPSISDSVWSSLWAWLYEQYPLLPDQPEMLEKLCGFIRSDIAAKTMVAAVAEKEVESEPR